MRTIIPWLVVGLICCHTPLHAQQLTAAEYFIDVDPGVGEGIPVSITAADQVDATFAADVSALPAGFHTLSTRFKNADAVWGQAVSRLFYVYGGTVIIGDPAPLTAGEYFIDLDPGMGQATAFAVTPGDQATATFGVDMSAVSVGFHTLSTRFKNTDGQWVHSISRLFYIYGGSGGNDPAAPLTAGEYFVDTDPGVGQAVAFAVTAGDQTSATFGVDVAAAGVGFHTLSMRFKNADGQWSQAISRLFYIYGGNVGAAANIVAAEYFVDTDPGAGNGTAIPTGAPQDTVNFNALIDVSALPIGEYVLFVRVKDADGVWSMAEARPFTICTFDGPVAAFDFVKDNMVVSFDNQSENQVSCSWDFGDGGSSTATDPFHTYTQAGVYDVCLVSYNPCLASGDTICQLVSAVGLTSVTPNNLANTGNFILDLTGAGFLDLSDLRLVKNGEADLVPDSIVIESDVLVRASFTFSEAPIGFWSVQGVLALSDTVLLQQAVELSPPVEPDLWVSIAGDGVLRVGFSQVYTITIGNDGNLDAYWPTVFLENLPIGTEFVFLDSLYGGESVPAYDTLGIDWAEVRNLNLVDSTTMTSFFPFQVHRVPANSVVNIGVIFHIPDTTELHTYYDITASVAGPVYTSSESQGFRSVSFDCVMDIASLATEWAADLPGLGGCVGGLTQLGIAAYQAFNDSPAITNNLPGRGLISLSGALSGSVKTFVNCAFAAGAITTPLSLALVLIKYEKILDRIGLIGAGINVVDALDHCQPQGPAESVSESAQNVIIGNAWDPNEKYGPGGGSHGQFMNAGQAWPYTIGFENAPAANLPAQTVTVIDSLDLLRFDISTFAFTSVTIGTQSKGLSGNPKSFIRDFDLQASMGVNARVTASCDTSTGVVRWVFNSIDPGTGQNTLNALDGFLPPDTLSPNGQGYVSFIVDLLPGVADADSIRNTAHIIFDFNQPIVTNTWENVLDVVAPHSQVDVLPAMTPGDSALITWSGQDSLSGVRYYSIYADKDGEGYLTWRLNTNDTSAWFHGVIGSTYQFYSIATDSAGNVEEAPIHFDAETEFVIPGSGISELNDQEFGVALVPNPNQGRFELRLHSNQVRRSTIQITDMLGQPVHAEEAYIQPGRTVRAMEFPSIASGIYLITIHTEGRILKLRWVKN